MKTLLYANGQKTLHCEMTVDTIGDNDEMTIMKLMGVTDGLIRLGFNHDIKPFTMVEAKKISTDLNLSLSIYETGKDAEVINVQDPFILDTTESLPNGKVGDEYSEEILVAGGNLAPGYPYEVEYGEENNIPAGLQFNENTLTLEGEPEESGTGFKFQISIFDSLGAKVDFEATFDIAAADPAEITGYDAISNIDGGKEGAATYATVELAKAALPATVKITGTEVTVPVTWSADSAPAYATTEGTYVFTGTIGALPEGYVDEVETIATVTASVVIAAA